MTVNYIGSILIASVAGGIINGIMPESGSMRKYIKLITALVMTAVIIVPVSEIIHNAGEIFDIISVKISDIAEMRKSGYLPESGEWIIKESADNISESLEDMICRKFGIDKNDISADVIIDSSDQSGIIIKKIRITLAGAAVLNDSDEIRQYASEISGCDIDIERKNKLD